MPGAFVPSSASKHARRLSTVKWCIRAVNVAPGSLRARLAMDSTPVVAVAPSVCGRRGHRVRDPMCPPWLSGHVPRVLARMGASDFRCAVGHPPGVPVVPPYPRWRSASDLPSSRPCPADVPRSSTPVGSRGPWPLAPLIVAFPVAQQVGTHNSPFITGLNPFTRAHCGPSAPCVRFMAVVTFGHATLGIRCLAKASGAGTFPRLTGPSFARRSSNGTKNVKVRLPPLLPGIPVRPSGRP